MPRDCRWVPACPRKSTHDCVAAACQPFRDYGKSQHTSGARLHPQRPCSSTSECSCSPRSTGALPVGRPHSLYQMSSQQGHHLSLCGPKTPGLHSAPGIRPSHQSTSTYQTAEFQTLRSPFIESPWNLSPLLSHFSLFGSVCGAVATLHFLSSCFHWEVLFPPPVSDLSPQAKTAPCPLWPLSPPVKHCTAYLLSSVVPVVQVVVLILKSVF